MGTNWRTVKFGDICKINNETYSISENWDFVNYLDTGNITKNVINEFQFISIKNDKLPSRARRKVKNGNIIYSTVRPNQEHYGYITSQPQNFLVSTGFAVIDVNLNLADSKFIYYNLTQREYTNLLQSIAEQSTTTYPSIKSIDIANLKISIPSLSVQKKIAAILSALDDKIELNEKINQNLDWEDYFRICRRIYELEKENQNLESQAQAIFKSWFVDFEPFGGKMPADWKSGTFSELITNTVGGDWGKDELQDNYTEEVYCIRGADIPDVKIGNRGKMPKRYILQKNYSLKKLNDGDLVVEISGGSPTQSTGRIAAISDYLLNRYKNKIICTNFCKSLKPRKNYSEYVYHYWQYLYDKNIFFGYENGTTGIKNLDISAFLETEPVIIPSQNILVAFAEVCRKTFAQIYHNGYENETLAQLRDTLLPKLMSGEIDVSDVAV